MTKFRGTGWENTVVGTGAQQEFFFEVMPDTVAPANAAYLSMQVDLQGEQLTPQSGVVPLYSTVHLRQFEAGAVLQTSPALQRELPPNYYTSVRRFLVTPGLLYDIDARWLSTAQMSSAYTDRYAMANVLYWWEDAGGIEMTIGLPAPTNLTYCNPDPWTNRLTWDAVAGAESYDLQHDPDGNGWKSMGLGAISDAQRLKGIDTGRLGDTDVRSYRVRAYDTAGGYGTWSATLTTTSGTNVNCSGDTGQDGPVPNQGCCDGGPDSDATVVPDSSPTGPSASSIDPGSPDSGSGSGSDGTGKARSCALTLSWSNPVNTRYNSILVKRATVSGGPYSLIASLPYGATSYEDTGLAAGTTYYYRLAYINKIGSGVDSAEVSAATSTDVSVSLDSPLSGDVLHGTVTMRASMTSANLLSADYERVEFVLNGQLLGESFGPGTLGGTASQWSAAVNTTGLANTAGSPISAFARVWTKDGCSSSSSVAMVDVANSGAEWYPAPVPGTRGRVTGIVFLDRNGVEVETCYEFEDAVVTRQLNGISSCIVTIKRDVQPPFLVAADTPYPDSPLRTRASLPDDWRIRVRRWVPELGRNVDEFEGVITMIEPSRSPKDTALTWTIGASSYEWLMHKRPVRPIAYDPPFAGTYDIRMGKADVVIKGYVRRAFRNGWNVPQFAIEPDRGQGNELEQEARFDDLLELVTFLGEAGDVDWGTESRGDGTYRFRTGYPFWGKDRSEGNPAGNRAVVFQDRRSDGGSDLTSWRAPRSSYDMENHQIVGGSGELTARRVAVVENASSQLSPTSFRPAFLDASRQSTYKQLAAQGRSRLKEVGQPQESLEAEIHPEAAPVYRRDYDLGDLVTVKLAVNGGKTFHEQVRRVRLTIGPTWEEPVIEVTVGRAEHQDARRNHRTARLGSVANH